MSTVNKVKDWRTEHVFTEIRNQRHYSICWACAIADTAAADFYIKHKHELSAPPRLSVQQLVECNRVLQNQMYAVESLRPPGIYTQKVGLTTEECYGHAGEDRHPCCRDPGVFRASRELNPRFFCASIEQLSVDDEERLMNEVDEHPIIAAFPGSSWWQNIDNSQEIYWGQACEQTNQLSHVVIIVGYKTVERVNVWIVRNSWSPQWGYAGYGFVCRNSSLHLLHFWLKLGL